MAETKTAENPGVPTKKSKHRSPNYPAIGLEKALERARTIKDQAGRNFMGASVAHDLWNYKKGAGDQQVAALKAYGLIETQGEADKRQIRLTESAWRILGDAPDQVELEKEAALKPPIHLQIWQHYNGDLPKSDKVISDWLVWEKGFNQDFVGGFISQFRDTIAFANLSLSDKVEPDNLEKPTEKGKPTMNPTPSQSKPEFAPSPPPPPIGQKSFPLYLSAEQEGALYVPGKMKQSDFDLLKTQIDNSLMVMKATCVVPDLPVPSPRRAIWRNKDHDQPVTITGELGQKDGKRFYAAKETGTGIPEDELEFEE
jgi:hypothetical protein